MAVIASILSLYRHNFSLPIFPAANILLDKEKHRLCICDYGEASYLNEQEDNEFFEREGTPPYMAPEVVCAYYGCGYDLKCDMWSLGCIIYAMAKGKDAPFDYQKLRVDKDPLWFPSEYSKEVYDVDSWLSQVRLIKVVVVVAGQGKVVCNVGGGDEVGYMAHYNMSTINIIISNRSVLKNQLYKN